MQTHLEALKDQDQEFNDHFAPIYQAEHEKAGFLGQNLQEKLGENSNSFFIMQQKQLLQRDLSQNQRNLGLNLNESQRQMKIVMSEPKFVNPGLMMSNSNPNLRRGLNIPLKHEHQAANNCGFEGGLPQNLNNFGNFQNIAASNGKINAELQQAEEHERKQKGNVKNTYIKKINSLMNLSRVEDVQARSKNERFFCFLINLNEIIFSSRPQHQHQHQQHAKKIEFKEKEDASSKEKNIKTEKDSHFKRSISFNSNLSNSNNPSLF